MYADVPRSAGDGASELTRASSKASVRSSTIRPLLFEAASASANPSTIDVRMRARALDRDVEANGGLTEGLRIAARRFRECELDDDHRSIEHRRSLSRQPNGPQEETVFGLPPRAPGVSAVPPARALPMNDAPEEVPLGARGPMTGLLLADRYRIGRLLGEGGMGYVYEALHLAIDKRFAVKVLAQELCNHPAHVERFLREARTTSKIDHDNVVEISDSGPTPDGSVFFVMEYLQGEDLGALIEREGPQTWERTRHLMLQLCEALSAAHAHGVVHRDIKPQNCFRTTRRRDPDFLKVLDFGIAKLLGEEHMAGKKLTRSGQIFGTPEYMSPEQIRGMPADPRMDVYAAGVIMYELLIGRTPFEGETALDVLTKHIHDPIPALGAALVGSVRAKQIDAVIAGALAKDPSRRFQSAEELASAIVAVEAAGATQKVVEPSLDGMPATLAGVRRVGARSKIVVAAVTSAVAAMLAAVALFVVPSLLKQRESSREGDASSIDVGEEVVTQADAPEPTPAPVVASLGEPASSPLPSPVVGAPPTQPPHTDDEVVVAHAAVPREPPSTPAVDVVPKPKPSLGPKTSQKDVEAEARRLTKMCMQVDGEKWKKDETVAVTLTLEAKSGKVGTVRAQHSAGADRIAGCVVKRLSKAIDGTFARGRVGAHYKFKLPRPS